MDRLLEIDGNILLWIQDNLRNPVFDVVFTAITRLGEKGLIWIAFTLFLLLFKKYKWAGVASGISMTVTFVVVNVIVKNIVDRVRPYEVLEGLRCIVDPKSDFSFPSGHTAHAFAVGVVVLIMLPRKLGLPMFIFAFVMGFSRLYVGVHYPTDVLAGAAIGTIIALVSVGLTKVIKVRLTGSELGESEEKDVTVKIEEN